MAESSLGWTTSGTGDGSSSGYTMAQFTEWQRMLFAGVTGSDLSGVAPDYLNKLAVSGTSSPVAVNTGGALVYGFPYFNTASVNVVVPTPNTSTRIDRVVLRADWAAQTVRITRVAGTEGAGAPALTQTAGTTWDMPLAQASITTGGAITLTDEREFLTLLGDLSVSTAKVINDAITFAKLQNIATDSLIGRDTAGTGDAESITLGASLGMSGAGVLQRAALTGDVTAPVNDNATTIANNAVTTAKIAAAQVTQAKLGTDTLRMLIIPIAFSYINFTANTTYQEAGAQQGIAAPTSFDVGKLPTGATVKLCSVMATASGTFYLELYNKTNGSSVSGSEMTTTSSSFVSIESGDIKANLTSGSRHYIARYKSSGASIAVQAAGVYLKVEW